MVQSGFCFVLLWGWGAKFSDLSILDVLCFIIGIWIVFRWILDGQLDDDVKSRSGFIVEGILGNRH